MLTVGMMPSLSPPHPSSLSQSLPSWHCATPTLQHGAGEHSDSPSLPTPSTLSWVWASPGIKHSALYAHKWSESSE